MSQRIQILTGIFLLAAVLGFWFLKRSKEGKESAETIPKLERAIPGAKEIRDVKLEPFRETPRMDQFEELFDPVYREPAPFRLLLQDGETAVAEFYSLEGMEGILTVTAEIQELDPDSGEGTILLRMRDLGILEDGRLVQLAMPGLMLRGGGSATATIQATDQRVERSVEMKGTILPGGIGVEIEGSYTVEGY